MRGLRFIVAIGLMAWAGVVGQAAACVTPVDAAQEPPVAAPAEPRLLVQAVQNAPRGHADHHHHGPHQHDHGSPDGCCMLCCGAAVPHVLLSEPQLPAPCHVRAVPLPSHAAAVAKAAGWAPFRPPRTT